MSTLNKKFVTYLTHAEISCLHPLSIMPLLQLLFKLTHNTSGTLCYTPVTIFLLQHKINLILKMFFPFKVVFVQSIQDSETLTVVPLDEQSNTLQLAQPVNQSDVTTVVSAAADLSTGLQVLTSVSSSLGADQQQLPQELTVKQVEAMLNQSMICFILPSKTKIS